MLAQRPLGGIRDVCKRLNHMSWYLQHYSSRAASDDSIRSFTFTATTSASGSLLLGSSREFSGWDVQPSPEAVAGILSKAAEFLPDLQQIAPLGLPLKPPWVRVGLRPFSASMRPLIGAVKGVGGLFIAAGHEGSGLTLGPGTGELIAQHVLQPNSLPTYAADFQP